MSMKKIAALSAIASLAAVTVSAQEVFHPAKAMFDVHFGGASFRVPIETKLVKGAPYSAEVVTESIQTLADGNRIVQRSTARVYRDSEGRIRREEDRPSGGPTISITDPVAGVSFTLDSENHTAFQTPNMAVKFRVAIQKLQKAHELAMNKVEKAVGARGRIGDATIAIAPFEARRINEQVAVEKLPARDIEGVRAEGVRRTTTIPAGEIGNDWPIAIVSEEWFSPDLQVLVLTERKDPRVGTSTYRVLNINRSEPARYLFEVPSDYTVKQGGIVFHKTRPAPPRK